MICALCGTALDSKLLALEPELRTHPACDIFAPEQETLASQLKKDLVALIKWADSSSPRSLQVEPGPSEIGTVCDRQLAYKLTQTPEVNVHFDPWAAIVGTAIHQWLDNAVKRWSEYRKSTEWVSETRVSADAFISGHSDLYRDGIVIDHKTTSPEVMKQMITSGPKPEHKIQIQLYGLGYENQGLSVEHVALAFYPRGGRLRDMYVWTAPYDRTVAERALDRMYGVAATALELDLIDNPHRFEQVPATAGNHCGFCSWYDPNKILESGADHHGCPGR